MAMKTMCAWCGRELGWKDSKGETGISHGICPECLSRMVVTADDENE